MAEDLKALLDAVGITGRVATGGDRRGDCHRGAYRRALSGTRCGPGAARAGAGGAADRRQATLARAAAVEAGGMRAIAEASIAASYPPVVRNNPEEFRKFRARWLANDPQSFAAINRMLATEDITPELARNACPTLLTAGRHDPLRPLAVIEPMARQIPGAEFLELNSGHFASIQTPGLVLQAIHGFLSAQGL